MYGITEEQILAWIDQCDNQLKQLQNGKDFLYKWAMAASFRMITHITRMRLWIETVRNI